MAEPPVATAIDPDSGLGDPDACAAGGRLHLATVHLDGFGRFHDLHLELPPGLLLIVGDNESGKSTLRAAITGLLFGPPRGRSANRYPPLAGGEHGGRAVLVDEGGRQIRIERHGRRCRLTGPGASGGTVGEATTGEPGDLLFGGLDRRAYEAIFAVGLEELPGVARLGRDEIARRLVAAGGGAPLAEARREVAGELDDLLGGGRSRRRIHRELTDLAEVEAALAEAEEEARRSARLLERRGRLAAAAEETAAELAAVHGSLQEAQGRRAARRAFAAREDRQAPDERRPRAIAGTLLLLTALGVGLAALVAPLPAPLAGTAALAGAAVLLGAGLALLLTARRRPSPQGLADRAVTAGGATPESGEVPDDEDRPDDGEAALERQRARLTEQREALLGELGALDARLAAAGAYDRLPALRQRRGELDERVDRLVERWAEAALAERLLAAVQDKRSRQRLPRLVADASELLASLTGGRYRLVLPGAGGDAEDGTEESAEDVPGSAAAADLSDLQVEDERLRRKGVGSWSSGLTDQVYLSLRLALARQAGRRGPVPPLLLDDIHLRFDPPRQRRLARLLLELAGDLQIVLFSCRPAIAEALRTEAARAATARPATARPATARPATARPAAGDRLSVHRLAGGRLLPG